jgi:DeoR family transcriptional regulator of aga operon
MTQNRSQRSVPSKHELSTEERHKRILVHLNQKGQVQVDELAAVLEVSPSTVRRDLSQIEQQGLLRRFHGGAELVQPLLYEPFRHNITFSNQEGVHADEKRRIAQLAAEMVQPGEVISFTSGTTTTQITRFLGHLKDITIVTNTINVAMELSQRQDIKIFVTGGFVNDGWFSLVGESAIHALRSLYADKAFIGINGIDPQNGLTTHFMDEAAVVRAMIEQAKVRIVVADHSKIGFTARAHICGIERIDLLITDTAASPEHIEAFEARGLRVITV